MLSERNNLLMELLSGQLESFLRWESKSTLVIAEVIPFLVLAVGVDNIFLLSNEMDRQTNLAASSLPDRSQSEDLGISRGNNDFYEEDSLEDMMKKMTMRMLVLSEVIERSPSSNASREELRSYAAGSMFLAAILQCTVFVAAMALDADRTESNRLDCLPCLRIRTPISLSSHSYDYSNSSSNNNGINSNPDTSGLTNEGPSSRFIRRHYAPFLLKPIVKKIILAFFAGQISMGGRFTTCQPLSLANILEGERKRPESSFIAQTASSWFDDFFGWLNPALESCCRVKINDPDTFCSQRDSDSICPLGGQAAYSSAISLKVGSQDGDGDPNLAEEVEFCAHLSRAFMRAPGSLPRLHPLAQKERDERTWAALADVGSSVLSLSLELSGRNFCPCFHSIGITQTLLRSDVVSFDLDRCHSWSHPPSVLLSYFGGRGYASGEEENELQLPTELIVCPIGTSQTCRAAGSPKTEGAFAAFELANPAATFEITVGDTLPFRR
ncbi:hypothetical protein L7F22_027114 [Adiantum nelumboides]|nr:hypothetical protein [Adiantum nelumboides]